MKPKFQIKILNDEQFDRLPYPNVDLSLGVTDPATRIAYVRYTAIPELNKELVQHEYGHLTGEDKTHFYNGLHYKGLFGGGGGGKPQGMNAMDVGGAPSGPPEPGGVSMPTGLGGGQAGDVAGRMGAGVGGTQPLGGGVSSNQAGVPDYVQQALRGMLQGGVQYRF